MRMFLYKKKKNKSPDAYKDINPFSRSFGLGADFKPHEGSLRNT